MSFIFTRLNIGNRDDAQENSVLAGALLASYTAEQLVSFPVFGWVSDKMGNRKWPMIWGLFAGMVAIVMFAATTNFAMLVIARILQGVSGAAVVTLGFALLGDVYPVAERSTALGTATAGFAIGTILGLPVGGALYQFPGYWMPFIASAVFLVVVMILRLLVIEKPRGSSTSSALKKDDAIDETHPIPVIYLDMARDPAIMVLNAVSAIIGALLLAYEPTLPLYLKKEFGAESGTVGLIFLVIVAAGQFSAPIFGVLRDMFEAPVVIFPSLAALVVVVPLAAIAKCDSEFM
ncbi:MFS general substrate transporter [Gonapodya prolifera JEL478]|uniref:MFS general substrate transporter n=1 Tax=Gonapodya prolifera (strain JEL478) TaxID=1344416 RepID=A0A139AFU9_GONPJ|nr:MFS general substrate transporter [Gonapodya prolifera JEL478]|eukprot:KXS15691.1 MFS general substrate transporter [Gonapodya prolifera JEL478]